ncbi:gliding motility-associated C-terminal domain-containing protein [Vicingaceae bacterium]|nr:gliding motility-associated C-terminal domain-containing protein [Vicingaceae bacterium]
MKINLILFLFFASYFSTNAHEPAANNSFPFTENIGQWHENVLYRIDLESATIFFEKNSFHYQFISRPNYHAANVPEDNFERGHVFKANFLNSNSIVETSKIGTSNFYYNYYLGTDKNKWKSEVRSYSKIKYHELYSGIDLEVYTKNGFLKYDYIIKPGFSPEQILVEYDGVENPIIKNGNLIISHKLGEMIEEKPYAFQLINGKKNVVACNYLITSEGNLYFDFPEGYNEAFELTIDPVLIFSTYSGSRADNFGETATYDDLGNGYMGGIADGPLYSLTLGTFQTSYGGGDWDIAISKFSPDGSSLLFSTFLGGGRNETVHSMVVDNNQNLFIFGATGSSNFPTTTNTYDSTLSVSTQISTDIGVDFDFGVDIIVSKFNPSGTQLLSSTYFGGTGIDGINLNPGGGTQYDGLNFNYGDSHRGEIVIDSSGNCYIGTTTTTSNLPNTNGTYSGNQDGLILKFNNSLKAIIWSRYVGGSGRDAIYSIKVIDSNKVLIGGGTTSYDDFPTTSDSYQDSSIQNRSAIDEEADGFISIIAANGNSVEKSTFISTPNYDQVYFVEFDRFNNVYGYGQTEGGLFPLLRAPVANAGAGQFIVKLDENLDSLEFSTTFGNGNNTGRVNISPTAFLVDKCQNIYAAGWGGSIRPDFPGAISVEGVKSIANMPLDRDTSYGIINNSAFYLYVVNRNVDDVLYATLIGGSSSGDHVDGGTSRFDKNGIVYHSVCASCGTARNDFPTSPSAYSRTDNSPNGRCNNALFKLDFEIVIRADFSLDNRDICLKSGTIDSVKVTNSSVGATNITWDFYGDTVVSAFTDTMIYFTYPGNYTIRQVVFDSICALDDFLDLNILVRPDDIELDLQYDTLVCYSDSTLITANSHGKANEFRYSNTTNFSSHINSSITDSTLNVRLTPGINIFYVQALDPTRNACEKLDSIRIFYSQTIASASLSENTVCEGTPIQFNASVTNADSFEWFFGNGTRDTNLNPQFLYPVPGNYSGYFIYENQLCLLKDSIPFNVQVITNDLQINSPLDTLFCGTGSFNISVPSSGTITNYQYSSTRGFNNTLNSSPSANSFSLSQNDSSMYYIKISNDFCEETDSILVKYINYSLDLNAITDSACIPHLEPLQANVVGADSFQIIVNNGSIFRNNPTPLLVFNQEGNYSVKLLASNQRCNRKDSIIRTISIFKAVELQSISDTLLCKGDSVILTSNSNGTAASYTWSLNPDFSFPLSAGNDSSIKVSPDATTNYFIQGKNFICSDSDTILVEIEELTIDVNDFESFCIYDTISLDAIVVAASSPLEYSWTPKDSIISGDNLISAIITPQSNQYYYLYTNSLTGCEDFDTVEVEVNLPAFNDAFIIGTDSLFKGQETRLSTNRNGSNLTYEWEPADDLDNPNSPNPNATLRTTTTYRVTITDLNTGCEVVALKRLRIFEVNCAEPDIFIPTAFSPNGDFTNDILFVRGANIREIEFQLFNRWGEMVFETTETNKGWDGAYQGKKVDPGVFVYQVKAICFDGQEFIDKGNITLLK